MQVPALSFDVNLSLSYANYLKILASKLESELPYCLAEKMSCLVNKQPYSNMKLLTIGLTDYVVLMISIEYLEAQI